MTNDPKKQLDDLLMLGIQKGASDIHISPGHVPTLRIEGRLVPLPELGVLSSQVTAGIVNVLLGDKHREEFDAEKDADFSYQISDELRFRVNAYHARNNAAAVLHVIPQAVRSAEELRLPENVKLFTKLSQGFVLVAGATGQGKSSTLAALINIINQERAEKILTIEDPIEYVFSPEQCVIDQREIGEDAPSFGKAIRAAFRENINVLMIGEMRDYETISAGVTAAETGHLVFSTLHTNSAPQTIERIINAFPANEQNQIISQLAGSLSGIISQRLIPSIQGGLVPAVEVLVANSAVRNIIRSNKPEQLGLAIDTGFQDGMLSLNRSLANLVTNGDISEEQAAFYSPNVKELKPLLGK